MRYIGSEYPLYDLGGGKSSSSSENFFDNHYLERDRFPFSILCNGRSNSVFYPITFNYNLPQEFNNLNFDKTKLQEALDRNFSSNLRKDRINSCFDEGDFCCHQDSKNLIYYTQIIDAFNHGYSKEHPRAFSASYAINKGIMQIVEWIDENPEYVLILLSDHGGQAYLGEDNYCNHGCLNPGNEGVLFMYMKNFDVLRPKQRSEPEIISTFEVASIISQVIENVNIPLENAGKIVKIVENRKIY